MFHGADVNEITYLRRAKERPDIIGCYWTIKSRRHNVFWLAAMASMPARGRHCEKHAALSIRNHGSSTRLTVTSVPADGPVFLA